MIMLIYSVEGLPCDASILIAYMGINQVISQNNQINSYRPGP